MVDHKQGSVEENGGQQQRPVPQAFNPLPPGHVPNHIVDSQHTVVHSVVPDLMRVYESLTKGNTNVTHDDQHLYQQDQQGQEQQSNQQQQQDPFQPQQDTVIYQQQQQQQHPGAPEQQSQAQHVNYAFINSEEQYQQIYNNSQGDPQQHPMTYAPPQQGAQQYRQSLPSIPPPLTQSNLQMQQQQQGKDPSVAQPKPPPSSVDGDSSTKSLDRPKRRRSNMSSNGGQPLDDDPHSSESTGGNTKKSSNKSSRKKAKETDGRWSKRFTWPDELHRDFVSAVFDVGLKHSSPSTILEHMPKHPQITSERVKSHLQKYRLHRTKSKQEFMTSYDSSLKNIKSGEMINGKTLTDGQVAAHLSHSVITDAPAEKDLKPPPVQNPAASKQANAANVSTPAAAAGPPTHEALMLPRLTEEEKNSPIGASMGYLLGLFFSLKKQLLMQRALKTPDSSAPEAMMNAEGNGPIVSKGPVTAVYNSFVDTSTVPSVASMPHPAPVGPVILAGGAGFDWSGGGATMEPLSNMPMPHPPALPAPPGAPITASVPNPVVPPQNTGSTRNNLEASSMMKREMQNQMAFQNKMRALKQQELNKYKDVSPSNNNDASHHFPEGEHDTSTSPTGHHVNNNGHHYHSQTQNPHHPQQEHSFMDEHHQKGGEEMGDDHGQGTGEDAQGRNRGHSFAMGVSDEMWNADVMDEQLFEFLMNN